jgi:hypothetical protein
MEDITIVVRRDGAIRLQNLSPVPKPGPGYAEEMKAYEDADNMLPAYQVRSMVCDSGVVVCGSILSFKNAVGKKFNARVLEGNDIQIF